MDSNDVAMKAALLTKEWYEGCMPMLSDNQQLQLYRAICEYTFYGRVGHSLDPVVQAMWTLIRPRLDDDRDKYIRRCERNKANANRSHSQPVAPSGSQSLPVATNNNTNTNTNTNNNNNTNTLSLGEREKFDFIGLFWSRGALNPAATYEEFYNYYDALGWRSASGGEIRNKMAAARQWRIKDVAPELTAIRAPWYAAMKDCPVRELWIWECWRSVVPQDGTCTLHLVATQEQVARLESDALGNLQRYVKSLKCTSLQYRCSAPS